jgi:hypothetical protein
MRYELSTYENFDEKKYLVANPDVVQGILRQEFKNGLDHFEITGINEQRFQKISLEKDLPLAVVHIPKCAGTSLRMEIDRICPTMYTGTKYAIRDTRKKSFFRKKSKVTEKEVEETWTHAELSDARIQYDCVMGHISLGDFECAGFKDFVIIVREPRIRLLSEWLFLQYHKEYESVLKFQKVVDTKSYFANYAPRMSNNVIAQLVRQDVIFDWKQDDLKISSYWSDEIPRLMNEVFGVSSIHIRANQSRPQMFEIDFRIMDKIYELTEKDFAALNRMTRSGLLSFRSREKMDEEFNLYMDQNFKYVRRLL